MPSDVEAELGVTEEATRITLHRLIRVIRMPDVGRSLSDALDAMASMWARQSSATHSMADSLVEEPPELIRTVALRMAREVFDNIQRHAHARRVDLTIEPRSDGILIQVVDDGVGFEPAHRQHLGPGRLGLMLLEEHAVAVGGFCKVISEPGRGTRVAFWIPLDERWRS